VLRQDRVRFPKFVEAEPAKVEVIDLPGQLELLLGL